MVIHFAYDGNILLKGTDDANDQESFWEDKRAYEGDMLKQINSAIFEEFGADPCNFKSLNLNSGGKR
jgi:hypothetical protein